jgi:hypothetical protein
MKHLKNNIHNCAICVSWALQTVATNRQNQHHLPRWTRILYYPRVRWAGQEHPAAGVSRGSDCAPWGLVWGWAAHLMGSSVEQGLDCHLVVQEAGTSVQPGDLCGRGNTVVTNGTHEKQHVNCYSEAVSVRQPIYPHIAILAKKYFEKF